MGKGDRVQFQKRSVFYSCTGFHPYFIFFWAFMMMDLTIQCLVGCKQQMRSDTPLGGEGGRREMRVGDGPPAHLLGGHASSGEGSWVWGGRSGSPSSSCSRKHLHSYKMERKGGSLCVALPSEGLYLFSGGWPPKSHQFPTSPPKSHCFHLKLATGHLSVDKFIFLLLFLEAVW